MNRNYLCGNMSNNRRLLWLVKEFGLTSAQVASLCRVEVGTVSCWRKRPDVSSSRVIPNGSLELLELKLGVRELEFHNNRKWCDEDSYLAPD